MKLYLAPLQGVTEYPFRNAFHKHFRGLDAACTPFITTTKGKNVRLHHIRDVLPLNNTAGLDLIPQILGNNSDEIVIMVQALAGIGYNVVNLNLGCPSQKVVRHKRGCGLMPFPETVDAILKDVLPATDVRISVKIRSGLKSTDELWNILDVLDKYPLHNIILHPRLGIQMYGGEPDLDVFSDAITRTRHALVYNGDIKTPEYFAALRKRFPEITGWMIGRGVLINPFLPGILKGIEPPGKHVAKDILVSFYHELIENHSLSGIGETRLASQIKEYWYYFSHWFSDSQKVWQSVSRSGSLAGVKKSVEEAFKGELKFFC